MNKPMNRNRRGWLSFLPSCTVLPASNGGLHILLQSGTLCHLPPRFAQYDQVLFVPVLQLEPAKTATMIRVPRCCATANRCELQSLHRCKCDRQHGQCQRRAGTPRTLVRSLKDRYDKNLVFWFGDCRKNISRPHES